MDFLLASCRVLGSKKPNSKQFLMFSVIRLNKTFLSAVSLLGIIPSIQSVLLLLARPRESYDSLLIPVILRRHWVDKNFKTI